MTSKAWIVTGLILIWAVGASGLGAFYYYQYTTVEAAYQNLVNEDTMIASIGFDYGNGTTQWFNSTTLAKNTTVLEFTQNVAIVNGTQFIFGFYVEAINDVWVNASGNEKYWLYSVSGEAPIIGSDAYVLRFGDVVLWSYMGF